MASIGIMQGRLSPRFRDQYQAHPATYWQVEFPIAREMGLSRIEWIFDEFQWENNALLTDSGNEKIRKCIEETGVQVDSVCADYFMTQPLFGPTQRSSLEVLKKVLERSSRLGISHVVLPFVDQSSVQNANDRQALLESLQEVLPLAQEKKLFLNLEMDLAPGSFAELLSEANSPQLKVNYDIGNSASLGFDPVEEFSAYGSEIADVHIKDRPRGEFSVPLGSGDADIPKVFSLLKQQRFQGPLILQAARSNDGTVSDLQLASQQLQWAQKHWEEAK